MKKTIGIIGAAGTARFTQAEICKAFGVPLNLVGEPVTQQQAQPLTNSDLKWSGFDPAEAGSDRTVISQFLIRQPIRIEPPRLDPDRFVSWPFFGSVLRPSLPSLIDPRFADSGEASQNRVLDGMEKCLNEMLLVARTELRPRRAGKSIVSRFQTKYGEMLARNVYRGELIDERRELERKWQSVGSWNVRPARLRHLRKLRLYYRRVALWGVV
ncbi:hypothetical protein D3C76_652710 [compost metagenome]